jgi:hypothetical protein
VGVRESDTSRGGCSCGYDIHEHEWMLLVVVERGAVDIRRGSRSKNKNRTTFLDFLVSRQDIESCSNVTKEVMAGHHEDTPQQELNQTLETPQNLGILDGNCQKT